MLVALVNRAVEPGAFLKPVGNLVVSIACRPHHFHKTLTVDHIEFEIVDKGSGFPPEVLSKFSQSGESGSLRENFAQRGLPLEHRSSELAAKFVFPRISPLIAAMIRFV